MVDLMLLTQCIIYNIMYDDANAKLFDSQVNKLKKSTRNVTPLTAKFLDMFVTNSQNFSHNQLRKKMEELFFPKMICISPFGSC